MFTPSLYLNDVNRYADSFNNLVNLWAHVNGLGSFNTGAPDNKQSSTENTNKASAPLPTPDYNWYVNDVGIGQQPQPIPQPPPQPLPQPLPKPPPQHNSPPSTSWQNGTSSWQPSSIGSLENPNSDRNIFNMATLARMSGINMGYNDARNVLEQNAVDKVFNGDAFRSRVNELMNTHSLDEPTAEATARHEVYSANPQLAQTYSDIFRPKDEAILHSSLENAIAQGMASGDFSNFNNLVGTGINRTQQGMPAGISEGFGGNINIRGNNGETISVPVSHLSTYLRPITPDESHNIQMSTAPAAIAANSRSNTAQDRMMTMLMMQMLRGNNGGSSNGGLSNGNSTEDAMNRIVNMAGRLPQATWNNMDNQELLNGIVKNIAALIAYRRQNGEIPSTGGM